MNEGDRDSEQGGTDEASTHAVDGTVEFGLREDLTSEVTISDGVTRVPLAQHWRRPTTLVVALVLVAAVVGGVVLTNGSSSNADAAVVRAVDHALADKSAAVSMNLSEHVTSGTAETLTFSGTGGIDFSNDTYQVNLAGTADGQNLTINVLYIGGSIYEGMTQISQLVPGKNWLSLNVASLVKSDQPTSASALGENPLTTLQTLAQQGNTVTPLGTSTVDGQSVEGYSVSFSPSTLEKEAHSASLPSWMRAAAQQISFKSASETVFVSGTTLVQVGIAETVSTAAANSATVNETLNFSNYGTPVTITAPPASQTISFTQFLKLAGQPAL
jgi:hypothetical protein